MNTKLFEMLLDEELQKAEAQALEMEESARDLIDLASDAARIETYREGMSDLDQDLLVDAPF